MARLSADAEREERAARRSCGECSLCCTLLRVDELAKPAGEDCPHQRGRSGCGIHARRPPICRKYECLWLQGGLEEDERPDRIGGIVDLEPLGVGVQLKIGEVRPGAFDSSPRLQAIASRYREQMPVRVIGTEDVMNPDRPFRVLLAGNVEHKVAGEWNEIFEDGVLRERKRLGWAERIARRVAIAWRTRTIRRAGRTDA